MHNFSLNTFLKICLLDTGDRISAIRKKLEPFGDGYDYYHSYKSAVREHCNGASDEDIDLIFDSVAKKSEREQNRAVYEKICTKFGKKRSFSLINKTEPLVFTHQQITIKVAPIFSIEEAGIPKVYCVWPNLSPDLSQKYGAIGCYLMRQAFKNSALANAQFHIFDTTRNRVSSEKQTNSNTKLIFETDLKSISDHLKEL